MKNKIYFKLIGVFALLVGLISCEPYMDENPDSSINLPPDASEMAFTVTPGDDDFHYTIALTSPTLSGISKVKFNLGNGSTVVGKSTSAYYPLPGDYTITMTITTNGGSSSISQVQTTTETDYSIFTDEKYVALTGGVDDADGKTWVVDSESAGHFGVGDAYLAGGVGLDWWSANPGDKEGTGSYDDELTFNLNGFAVSYENFGVSYVKGYMKDDPNLASVYLNPRQNKDDWDVDYETPTTGTWLISERDGKTYLTITSEKPIIPGLDVGALNNEYEIISISENYLELSCFSAYEDWTKWHFLLRNKDYEKPKVTFDVALDAGTGVNEYLVSVGNAVIPDGQSIDKVVVDFGDGTTAETDIYTEALSHVYMRKGTYAVKVTVTTSVESTQSSFSAVIDENHPDYVEFLLAEMVMYNDFSEVQLAAVNGQDCFVATADNPDRTYPNKSSKVGFYSKTNQQWANANMQLPAGYRFDLRQVSTFKLMVYGKAGDVVLLKLENTDKGGDAWMTGTELRYTIQNDNMWEVAEFNFEGAGVQPGAEGWKWWPEPVSYDVANDDFYNHDFYNIIRIMLNPDIRNDETHEFYFDELAGPHVEGIKSASIN
ncbi:PKD domain-containing protein [uncultured Draconibacterium sp.]|uniref:PKD domain-containing protein n=1 Tax=uncultured Draconibacterium sp. TaxID=1573823 RepID=UPI0032163B4C